MKAICHFTHDTLQAFEFYKMIYADVPIFDWLIVLLKVIYTEFKVDESIMDWIHKCLADETPSIRQQRIKHNTELLKDYINKDNTVTVYRGINQSNRGINALSWSIDKYTAIYFATNGIISGSVVTAIIKIDDVLTYNSNIDEYEIVILPESINVLCEEKVTNNPLLYKKLDENSVLFKNRMIEFINDREAK
jgi:hypothetical protein